MKHRNCFEVEFLGYNDKLYDILIEDDKIVTSLNHIQQQIAD